MESKKSIWSDFKGIIATIGGFVGWSLGGGDGMLLALVAIVAIDYITSVLCGIVDKNLSEYAGIKVIASKFFIFVLVAVGYIIDTSIIGEGSACRMAVIFFYLSDEGISVLENAVFLGVPFPEKLREMLLKLNDKAKPEDGDDA